MIVDAKLQTVQSVTDILCALQDSEAGADWYFLKAEYLEFQHCIEKLAVWSYDILDQLDLAHRGCFQQPSLQVNHERIGFIIGKNE